MPGGNEPYHNLNQVPGYELRVIQCQVCRCHWVRNVPSTLYTWTKQGSWLCPRGWTSANCNGGKYRIVDRPDIEAIWRLTGMHGFGDMVGHP